MIFTLAAKELKALFASPLAWAALALLQLILAWVFLARLDAFLTLQPQLAQLANPPGATELVVPPLFGVAALVLLTVTPLLAMRLVAEERRNQTFALLLSSPVSSGEIVLGKFLGLVLFLAIFAALTAAMALSIYAGGAADAGLILANLLGLLLLCASFAAAGLYFSCLTAHPAVAAVGALGLLFGSWLIGIAAPGPDSLLHLLSLAGHFEGFNKGVLDSADFAYFLLFTALFLLLAGRRLDGERRG